MNPKYIEEEYYNRLIKYYDESQSRTNVDFLTLACQELLQTLQEEKLAPINSFEKQAMKKISTKSIILILALIYEENMLKDVAIKDSDEIE